MRCGWCGKDKDEQNFSLHWYRGVHKRKATCSLCEPLRKEWFDQYWQSDKGKKAIKTNNQRPEKKAGSKTYRTSAKGKATNAKNQQRNKKSRSIGVALASLLSGSRKSAPPFTAVSDLNSVAKVKEFFKNKQDKEVEHKIPIWCYNHDDQEDVKRCWHSRNLQQMDAIDNEAKGIEIQNQCVEEMGAEGWPALFGGEVPSQQQKEEWYARVRSGGGFEF